MGLAEKLLNMMKFNDPDDYEEEFNDEFEEIPQEDHEEPAEEPEKKPILSFRKKKGITGVMPCALKLECDFAVSLFGNNVSFLLDRLEIDV